MDNTMLATLAAICGLTAEEREVIKATYELALVKKPEVVQSISRKVEQAVAELISGTHKSYNRINKRRKLKDYEIVCDIRVGNVSFTLFRSWIGPYSDKPYLAAEWADETPKGGYRNLYYGEYPDVLMNYYERLNHRLETMAYHKDNAMEPGHTLFAIDCIKDSRDTMDYTGEVVVLLPVCFCDGFKYADLQYYYAEGGPGCDPKAPCDWTNKDWIEGMLLATGERWTAYRMLTAGIIKPDLLPAWVAERVNEIKGAKYTQNGGNSDGK